MTEAQGDEGYINKGEDKRSLTEEMRNLKLAENALWKIQIRNDGRLRRFEPMNQNNIA